MSAFSTLISRGNKKGKQVAQTEAIACSNRSPDKLQDQDPVACHGTHEQVNIDAAIPNAVAKET